MGIYEYLRAPPNRRHETAAREYLASVQQSAVDMLYSMELHTIQTHRVIWILEWLRALPDDTNECSDAETVVHNDADYEEVW